MEKQKKVLNKIKHSIDCGQTTPLGTKPNDECCTSMQDILNELSYWAALDKFRGKNIICPCDWDIVAEENIYSIHITYGDNFEVVGNDIEVELGLFDEKNAPTFIKLKESEIDDFLKNKLTCNFVRTFTQKARAWGIKSITASRYNPANGKGIPFQKVDYSKYDVCCTNPPFSLYAEFMKCIVGNIDFICLAPFLNRVNPNIGLPLMLRQAYLRHGCDIGDMKFYNPNKDNSYKIKTIAFDWITSFAEAQNERNEAFSHKQTGIDYSVYKDEYLVMENMTMMDGTHLIRVATSQIPDDYSGWMFGTIQFLQLYDLRQFEWYGTGFKGYYNKINPAMNPFNHLATDTLIKVGDKQMFHGIVFRRKPTQED